MELEYDRATGSNIPTFDEPTLAVRVRDGVKMMFPEGKRHPPPKKTAQLAFDKGTRTFEDVKAEGLITRMFEFWGTPMTFPLGARTRLAYPPVPTVMFEEARDTGSNWMTFAVLGEGAMTFPLGRRQGPVWLAGPME